MKRLIIFLFFVPLFAKAQKTHTVAPKETLYSVARKYNVPPKELAAYNNLTIETGLTIGQVIKIPANGTVPVLKTAPPPANKAEAIAKKTEPAATSGVPIYHKVEKKETLYHISKLYPNVTMDDIKKWNNLSTDGVTEGTNLIVGYEKGKKATTATNPVKENTEVKTVAVEPVKEKTITPEKTVAPETRAVLPPVTTEPAKQETVKVTGKGFGGGYFKTQYTSQSSANKEEIGTAAVFKSTSGWEDGKYYCLHNTAPSGTIVKITNKSTQKTIYAKVLDVIPDLKQNTGILIRLSNAAADELAAGENNFEAVVNY
ncbi:MAG: LysM peptidoglycan-binding domain-containing protein [Ferruginibacter sp.]